MDSYESSADEQTGNHNPLLCLWLSWSTSRGSYSLRWKRKGHCSLVSKVPGGTVASTIGWFDRPLENEKVGWLPLYSLDDCGRRSTILRTTLEPFRCNSFRTHRVCRGVSLAKDGIVPTSIHGLSTPSKTLSALIVFTLEQNPIFSKSFTFAVPRSLAAPGGVAALGFPLARDLAEPSVSLIITLKAIS